MAKSIPSLRVLRRLSAALVVALLGTGCAVPWTGKDGTRHHLIVGCGIVSTRCETNLPVSVTRTAVAGIEAGNSPSILRFGLSSSLTTRIADNVSNVVVEASVKPLGRLQIQTLTQTKP